MKRTLIEGWKSFLKLLRFLVWYAVAVAVILWALPIVGVFLEDRYETMSNAAKFYSVIGFFVVVGVWQILSRRNRWRNVLPGKDAG